MARVSNGMKKSLPAYDRRLIGIWKSDRRKTFMHYKPKSTLSPSKLRRFKALFGKFVVRWGRGKIYTELDGWKDSGPYEIVASDAESVVVRTHDAIFDRPVLHQIHFEGDHYWIALDGGFCEWFRRVKPEEVGT